MNSPYRFTALIIVAMALSACQTAPVKTAPPVATVPATTPSVIKERQVPKVALALGGGAARGFAHIGVIQVLEENRIYPALVAGTSAGSMVAAMYAAGSSGAQLQRLAREMDESAVTDWTFPLRGLIRGEALAAFVRLQTAGKLIENMAIPLGIVATDLGSGEGVLFRRGDTGAAVRASSSVPSVFQPVKIGNREFVDGGLVSPVPVRYARQMCTELGAGFENALVIAVDISAPPSGAAPQDMLGMLLQTFAIMSQSINRAELQRADVVLRPDLSQVKSSDFSARIKAIDAGRAAALAALPEIRRKLGL